MKKSRSLLLATTGIINLCSPIFGAAAEGSSGRGLKSANVAPKAFAGARLARNDGKDGFGAMFGVSVPFWQDASKLFSITPVIDYGDKKAGGGVSGSLILGLYALQAENVISFRVMVTADNASSDAMLPDGYTKVNQNRVTYTQVGFGFGFDSPVFGLDANAYLASHNKAEKFASKSTLKQKTFGDPTTAAQGSGRLFDQFLDEYLYGVSSNVGDVAVYANIADRGRIGVYGRYTMNISASTKKPDEKGYHPATPGSHEAGIFADVGVAQVGPFEVGVQGGLRLMRRNDMKDVVLSEEREWKTSGTVGIFAKMGFNKPDGDARAAGKLDHLFSKVPNPFATKLHVSVNASAPYSKERLVDSGARAINISTNGLRAGSAPTNSAGQFAAFDSRTGFSSAWWNNAVTNPNGVEARYLLDQGISIKDAAGKVSIAPNVFYAHTVKVGTSKSDSISSVAGVMAAIISERALVGELSTQADLGITTISVLGGGSAPAPGVTNGAFDVEQYDNAEEVFVFGSQAPVHAVEAGKNEVIKKLRKDGLGTANFKNLNTKKLRNLPILFSSIGASSVRKNIERFVKDNPQFAQDLLKTLYDQAGDGEVFKKAVPDLDRDGEVSKGILRTVSDGGNDVIATHPVVRSLVNDVFQSDRSGLAREFVDAIGRSPLLAVLPVKDGKFNLLDGTAQRATESTKTRADTILNIIKNTDSVVDDFEKIAEAAEDMNLPFQKDMVRNMKLVPILEKMATYLGDGDEKKSGFDPLLDTGRLYVCSTVFQDQTTEVLGADIGKAVDFLRATSVQSGDLHALGIDDDVVESLKRINRADAIEDFEYNASKSVYPMEQLVMHKELIEKVKIMDNDPKVLSEYNSAITEANRGKYSFEQIPLLDSLSEEQDKLMKRALAVQEVFEASGDVLPSSDERASLMDRAALAPGIDQAGIMDAVARDAPAKVQFWGDDFSISEEQIAKVQESNRTFGLLRDVFNKMAKVLNPNDKVAEEQRAKEFLNEFTRQNGAVLRAVLDGTQKYKIEGTLKDVSTYDMVNADLVSAFVDKYVDTIITKTDSANPAIGIAANADVRDAQKRAHDEFARVWKPYVGLLDTHDETFVVLGRLLDGQRNYATPYFRDSVASRPSDLFGFQGRQIMGGLLSDNYKHAGAAPSDAEREGFVKRTSDAWSVAPQNFKDKFGANGAYSGTKYATLDVNQYINEVDKNNNLHRVNDLRLHQVYGNHGMIDEIVSKIYERQAGESDMSYATNVDNSLNNKVSKLLEPDEVLHTLAVHGVLPNQLAGKGIDTTGNVAAKGYVTQGAGGGAYVAAKALEDKAVRSLIAVRTEFDTPADYKKFVLTITSPTKAEVGLDAWKADYIAHQNQLDRLNFYTGVKALANNTQAIENGSLLLQIKRAYDFESAHRSNRTPAGDADFTQRIIEVAQRVKDAREGVNPLTYSICFADMDKDLGVPHAFVGGGSIDDVVKFAPIARALFWDRAIHKEHYTNELYQGGNVVNELNSCFQNNAATGFMSALNDSFSVLREFLLDNANGAVYTKVVENLRSNDVGIRYVTIAMLNAVDSLKGSVDGNSITRQSVEQLFNVYDTIFTDLSVADNKHKGLFFDNGAFRDMLPDNHFSGKYVKIRHVMRFWEQVASGLQRNGFVEYNTKNAAGMDVLVASKDNAASDAGKTLLSGHLELSRWRYGVNQSKAPVNNERARQNAAQYLDYCVYDYDSGRVGGPKYHLYADLSRATVGLDDAVAANNYKGFVDDKAPTVIAAAKAGLASTVVLFEDLIKHQKEILNIRLIDSVFPVFLSLLGQPGIPEKFVDYINNDPVAVAAMSVKEKSVFADVLKVAGYVDEASYLLASRVLSDENVDKAGLVDCPAYVDPTDANRTPYGVPYNDVMAGPSFINKIKEASRWFIGSDNLMRKGFNTYYAINNSNDAPYAVDVPEAYKHMRASMAGNMTTAALGTAEYTRDIAHVVGTAAGAMHWFDTVRTDIVPIIDEKDARKMGILSLLSLYYAPGNKPIPSDGADPGYEFGGAIGAITNLCAGIADAADTPAPHDVRLVTLATVRSLITQSGSGDLQKVYVPHIVSTGFQGANAAKGGIIGKNIEGAGVVGPWDPANGAKANDIANASQWALMEDAGGTKPFYDITTLGFFNPLSAGAMLGSFVMKAIRVQGDEKTFFEQDVSSTATAANRTQVRDYNLSLHTAFVNAGIGLTCARVAITKSAQFDGHYALANNTPAKMQGTVDALGEAIRGYYYDAPGGGAAKVEANLSDNPVFHGTVLGSVLARAGSWGDLKFDKSNTGAASIVATCNSDFDAGPAVANAAHAKAAAAMKAFATNVGAVFDFVGAGGANTLKGLVANPAIAGVALANVRLIAHQALNATAGTLVDDVERFAAAIQADSDAVAGGYDQVKAQIAGNSITVLFSTLKGIRSVGVAGGNIGAAAVGPATFTDSADNNEFLELYDVVMAQAAVLSGAGNLVAAKPALDNMVQCVRKLKGLLQESGSVYQSNLAHLLATQAPLSRALYAKQGNAYALISSTQNMNDAIKKLPELGAALVRGQADTAGLGLQDGNVQQLRDALLTRADPAGGGTYIARTSDYVKGYLVGMGLEHFSSASSKGELEYATTAAMQDAKTSANAAAKLADGRTASGLASNLKTMASQGPGYKELYDLCADMNNGVAGKAGAKWITTALIAASADAGNGLYAGNARSAAGNADAQRAALRMILTASGALTEGDVNEVMRDDGVRAAGGSATADGVRAAAVIAIQKLAGLRAARGVFDRNLAAALEAGGHGDRFVAGQRAAALEIATLLSIPTHVGREDNGENILSTIINGNPKLEAPAGGVVVPANALNVALAQGINNAIAVKDDHYRTGYAAFIMGAVNSALKATTWSGVAPHEQPVMHADFAQIVKADGTLDVGDKNLTAAYETTLGFDNVTHALKDASRDAIKKMIASFSGANKDQYLGLQNRGKIWDVSAAAKKAFDDAGGGGGGAVAIAAAVKTVTGHAGGGAQFAKALANLAAGTKEAARVSIEDYRYFISNTINLLDVGRTDPNSKIDASAKSMRAFAQVAQQSKDVLFGDRPSYNADGLNYAVKKVLYGAVARNADFIDYAVQLNQVGAAPNKDAYNLGYGAAAVAGQTIAAAADCYKGQKDTLAALYHAYGHLGVTSAANQDFHDKTAATAPNDGYVNRLFTNTQREIQRLVARTFGRVDDPVLVAAAAQDIAVISQAGGVNFKDAATYVYADKGDRIGKPKAEEVAAGGDVPVETFTAYTQDDFFDVNQTENQAALAANVAKDGVFGTIAAPKGPYTEDGYNRIIYNQTTNPAVAKEGADKAYSNTDNDFAVAIAPAPRLAKEYGGGLERRFANGPVYKSQLSTYAASVSQLMNINISNIAALAEARHYGGSAMAQSWLGAARTPLETILAQWSMETPVAGNQGMEYSRDPFYVPKFHYNTGDAAALYSDIAVGSSILSNMQYFSLRPWLFRQG